MEHGIIELNKNVENLVIQAGRSSSPYYFAKEGRENHVPLTFVHLSDIHNDVPLWGRMVEYVNHYSEYISFALHTGDYCGGTNAFYTDMYKEAKECVHPIYNCPGNHDCVTEDDIWTKPCEKSVVYNKLYNHTENWEVNFAPVENPMSYYKDFPESNVRLIVLDLYYDIYKTRTWLRDILSDALNRGLHVVTAMHEPTGYIAESFNTYYHHADDYETAQKNYELGRKEISFDCRGRITFEDVILEFIQNGGSFVCNLCGHDHIDSFGVTNRGILNVVVQNACEWDVLGDSKRVCGTKSYDCFNVVGIDTQTGLLKIIRIGNNADHFIREKNVLCFDYINKKLIYQA